TDTRCAQLPCQAPARRVKYLPEIDLFLLTWQRAAKTGEANDPTERGEGPAAIPVASATAADGASLRTTSWPDRSRAPIRRKRSNDSALAGALAAGCAAGARASVPQAPEPSDHAAGG